MMEEVIVYDLSCRTLTHIKPTLLCDRVFSLTVVLKYASFHNLYSVHVVQMPLSRRNINISISVVADHDRSREEARNSAHEVNKIKSIDNA